LEPLLVGVSLGGFAGVMDRVQMVPMGGMRVMRSLVVRPGIVMCCRLLVMACRVIVVLRGFPMMFCRLF
jgi:hypothetical protein